MELRRLSTFWTYGALALGSMAGAVPPAVAQTPAVRWELPRNDATNDTTANGRIIVQGPVITTATVYYGYGHIRDNPSKNPDVFLQVINNGSEIDVPVPFNGYVTVSGNTIVVVSKNGGGASASGTYTINSIK